MYPHQAERLTAALEADGLDALVAVSRANVAYVTGFRSLAGSVYSASEMYAVVTRAGTALVVPTIDALAVLESDAAADHVVCHGRFHYEIPLTRGESADRLARLVAEPAPSGADALAAALKALGLSRGRVGLDDALLTARTAKSLEQRLSDFTLVPASEAFATARLVKSPYEIDCLRASLHAAEEAIDAVLDLLRPGVTEREAAAAFEREVTQRGAGLYATIVVFGAGSAVPAPWPGDRALRAGELIRFDLGCVLKGYYSDVARMAVVGEPTPPQQATFDALHAGLEAALEAIRPGAAAGAVHAAAVAAARKAGLPRFDRHHVGYGIGLEATETPWLAPGATAALEMGTVLRVETPYYEVGRAGLNIKETVLVTRTGCHVINRSQRGLIVLDGL